ncbi:MAG: VWA domain-containing protein [Lachnospiraceae bacterium]|nr:VWA domain-containing protein [Lachnospiraceae bacterium]
MKKRLFALCAMGMVLLSACGSTSTAPASPGDAMEGAPQSVNTSSAAASTGESAVSYDSEPMAMMTESAAAEAPRAAASKMDTSGAGQPGSGSIQQQSMAGVLTAAEYSDLDNWDFFQELVQDQKISFPSYGLDPTNAVSVTVTDNNQQPLAGESVILQDVQGAVLWETITDAEGKAWLFYGANTTPDTISVNGQEEPFADEVSFVSQGSVQQDTGLQVMFILDTTGSMGDELNYLKEDFSAIVSEVGSKSILFSANFYRDQGDAYVTRCNPFTANVQTVQQQFDAEDARGGGDMPEAVADILYETMVQADWKDGYRKVAFMIFDAPPHDGTEQKINEAVRAAATQGIHVIPVVASNAERDTELFGRALAIMTNSEYVFLTDDPGVGDSHLEPIIGNYTVESLHDIIVRLIKDYQP